jgi:threonine-phosphate decarboxylase
MYKYAHGGDIYGSSNKIQGLLDYSVNINPLGLPESVKKAVQNSLRDCENYPDPFCRKLTAKIADLTNLPTKYILCGNGAADILFRIAFVAKPKRALILAPTFSDYERAVLAAGGKVEHYSLQENANFAVDKGILKAINKRIDMMILCNPNNPTGLVIDKKLLQSIVKKCASMNIRLVLDECFMPFVSGDVELSMLSSLKDYPNLVILRAFTKIYAMPGLRLGFCMTTDTEFLDAMRANGQDWSVSIPAQAAGLAALDEGVYVAKTKLLINAEREYMLKQLNLAGFKTYPSVTNYILLYRHDNINWVTALKKQGFLIRDCSNYENLGQGYYRVAVKKRATNRKLLKAIKDIIKHALINDYH